MGPATAERAPMRRAVAAVARQRWLPPSLVAAATGLLVASMALTADRLAGGVLVVLERSDVSWWIGWWTSAVVGALVLRRRPGIAVGWLLLIGGLVATVVALLFEYAELALLRQPNLPGGGLAAWAGACLVWVYTATVPLLLQVFPDGRLRGRFWAGLWWTTVAAALLTVIATALAAWPRRGPALLGLDEQGATVSSVAEVTSSILFLTLLTSAAVPAVRYRRADGLVRRQLKWLMLASVWLFVMVAGSEVTPALSGQAFSGLSATFIPIAIGVAVSRYRLYEVDRLISRTLTYAVVTTAIVGLYAAITVVPSVLFDLRSDLLVAAATLAAAATFVPLRRRMQAVVDRRFNRARYDAARVVDRFGLRLRDDVDLDRLADDVRATVSSSVQPTHVSLWVRHGEVAR